MKNLSVSGCVVMIILLVVGVVFSTILNGYVIEQLWQWFLTPIGAPAITTAQAIGIALVAKALTYHPQYNTNTDSKRTVDDLWALLIGSFVFAALWAAFYLLIGRIALSFITQQPV